ncbi:MAG: hypothetical protein Q7S55_04045 [Nanoarchaeota archaeon]|nr:hypothetical protein [Nanoarchaeota archaeon]
MDRNKHFLLAASFLGTFSCLPSTVPKTEITIPGSRDTVQMIDNGYSATSSVPPWSELTQKISKECSSKMCEFYFPEESMVMVYYFGTRCISATLKEKECLEVMVGLYEGEEISMASLMTDYQPFGSVDNVLLVKATDDIVEVSSDKLKPFDLLYERSISAGFSYNGRNFVSPQDLREIHQKAFHQYFVVQ